jgi:hypothetical protein
MKKNIKIVTIFILANFYYFSINQLNLKEDKINKDFIITLELNKI